MSHTAGHALRAARLIAARSEADPLRHVGWLPGQHRFLSSASKRKLYRAGNQHSGKTWAGLSEVRFRADGNHPLIDVAPHQEQWVICASWSQSVAIQEKYWQIARASLHPDVQFNPKTGFGQHGPTAIHANGNIVRFKTVKQGALNLASATIDAALFDEPPTSPRVLEEVKKRLMKKNGTLMMTMTPVNAGPMDWLKELCEAGQIEDIHVRLTPENMIPVGWDRPITLDDGTPCDANWIESLRADTLGYEAPVILDGEWEMRVTGRVFEAFNEVHHVQERVQPGRWQACIGIDYGTKVGKQVAVLAYVDATGEHPRVHVVDMYVGSEMSSLAADAAGVLEMLSRHNLSWSQIDHAWGDRVYIRGAETKSNRDLMVELATALDVRHWKQLNPRIRTVKRGQTGGRQGVDASLRYLHQCMVRPGGFAVHPRCAPLIEALGRWDLADDDNKDKIDALRYSQWDYVFARHKGGGRAGTLRVG